MGGCKNMEGRRVDKARVRTSTSRPVRRLRNCSRSAAAIRVQLVYIYMVESGEWASGGSTQATTTCPGPYLLPILGLTINSRIKASSRALQALPLDCVRWSQCLRIVSCLRIVPADLVSPRRSAT